MKKKFKFRFSVWQNLALGYLAVIIFGSIMLIMPFATKDGQSTSYLNALFTATSATCVTGLTPYVTAEHWTLFGQLVILFLIQTGGLGFMTFVSTVFLLFRRRMGLHERRIMITAAGGSRKLTGVASLVKRIFIGTAIFETAGAAILAIRFCGDFGAAKGIYFALWHSISAFCNAGFDLFGGSSLSAYATDPLVVLTICALIVLGGLGFFVWGDVIDCKCNLKKFQLNTKIVLLVSAIWLVLATGLFLISEWNNEYNFGENLLVAIFNATSPRTAGFYVTPPEKLSESGYLLTIILMFVGGSSGSTAGGIKVGTLAVIIVGIIAVFRGRRDINIGKKRIENSLLSQALAIFASCLILIMIASFVICIIEPNVPSNMAVFECVSAMGTVGLSMNLTPYLGIASRIILILLMYAGKVGILTLALALGEKRTAAEVRMPVDTLLIG